MAFRIFVFQDKKLLAESSCDAEGDEEFSSHVISDLKVKPETLKDLRKLKENLEHAFKSTGGRKWSGAVDNIWAFGPRGNGPNLLLNRVCEYNRPSIWTSLEAQENPSILKDFIGSYREFDHSLVSGFQLATLSGPLCEEPVHGVCFIVETWDLLLSDSKTPETFVTDNSSTTSAISSVENISSKNVTFADEQQSSLSDQSAMTKLEFVVY